MFQLSLTPSQTFRAVFLIRVVKAVIVAVATVGVWNAAPVFTLKEPRPAGGLGRFVGMARAVALVLVQHHAKGTATVSGYLARRAAVWHAEAEVGAVSIAVDARVSL